MNQILTSSSIGLFNDVRPRAPTASDCANFAMLSCVHHNRTHWCSCVHRSARLYVYVFISWYFKETVHNLVHNYSLASTYGSDDQKCREHGNSWTKGISTNAYINIYYSRATNWRHLKNLVNTAALERNLEQMLPVIGPRTSIPFIGFWDTVFTRFLGCTDSLTQALTHGRTDIAITECLRRSVTIFTVRAMLARY